MTRCLIWAYAAPGLITAASNRAAGRWAWWNLLVWPLSLPLSVWAMWRVDRYRRTVLEDREREARG